MGVIILVALLIGCTTNNPDHHDSNTVAVLCGRDYPTESQTPGLPFEALAPADIHDVVPPVDYTSAAIIDYINFENRHEGEYTEDMFNHDFDNQWGDISGSASILTVDGSKVLSVTSPEHFYKKGISSGKQFSDYDELYFSYQITFHADYDFSMGGKLPGLAGLNPDVSTKPDGCNHVGEDDGFSLRSMFREEGRAIGYFYHQDSTESCGEEIDYQHEGANFSFKRDKTYLLEQYVKMNDKNQANGIVELYVNGFKVLERTDMTFSENLEYAINYHFFQLWHGGDNDDWAVDRDSTAYFNHIALSSEPLSYTK